LDGAISAISDRPAPCAEAARRRQRSGEEGEREEEEDARDRRWGPPPPPDDLTPHGPWGPSPLAGLALARALAQNPTKADRT
ncbi:hypothetical protein THAOC_10766, partial [Thalassiosira oceanica]